MKRAARLALMAVLIALIALAFLHPYRMLSPGALTAGHAALREDCFACHVSWQGASASRCLACHALARIGLRKLKHSFHQELIEADCMACHVGHFGYMSVQRAPLKFSHGLLRASMRERCESCHAAPRDAIHGDIGAGCARCHGAEHWTPASFEHDEFFVLDRDHDVTCSVCHTAGEFRRYSCYGCHEHGPARMREEHLEEGIRNIDDCVACHRSVQ